MRWGRLIGQTDSPLSRGISWPTGKKALRVVVVGAGIVGSAIAFHLARRGARVEVVESGRPGGGASGHSFAYLNSFGKEPESYHDLNRRSMDMWDRFARLLGAEVGLTWGGKLSWESTEEGAEELRRRARPAPEQGLSVQADGPRRDAEAGAEPDAWGGGPRRPHRDRGARRPTQGGARRYGAGTGDRRRSPPGDLRHWAAGPRRQGGGSPDSGRRHRVRRGGAGRRTGLDGPRRRRGSPASPAGESGSGGPHRPPSASLRERGGRVRPSHRRAEGDPRAAMRRRLGDDRRGQPGEPGA